MTEIIDPKVRYVLMVTAALCAEKRSENRHWPLMSEYSAYASGMADHHGLTVHDITIALREMVALGHATEENGTYAPTPAGLEWLNVEAAVIQSSVDAHERAAGAKEGMT